MNPPQRVAIATRCTCCSACGALARAGRPSAQFALCAPIELMSAMVSAMVPYKRVPLTAHQDAACMHPGVTMNWQCSTRNVHLHSLITASLCTILCTQRAQEM